MMAGRLKERGVNVYSFSLDLPLTDGHLDKKDGACQLSVEDTARRLAETIRAFRQVYPNAKIIDMEVPTGIPVSLWTRTLTQWLDAYRRETGEDFYGLTMDVWWEFPWLETTRQTIQILRRRGIRAGIFLDADGHPGMTDATWINAAKQNGCNFRKAGLQLDHVVVANWMVMSVKNLPELSPLSLTSLLNWFASGASCAN